MDNQPFRLFWPVKNGDFRWQILVHIVYEMDK